MGNDLKQEIKNRTKDLANLVREYSRSQKELWQQVLLLALEAQGKKYSLDNYNRALKEGYWGVCETATAYGKYWAYVDLETGELVNPYEKTRLAPDKVVLRLAGSVRELDAERIVAELKVESEKPLDPQKNYAYVCR